MDYNTTDNDPDAEGCDMVLCPEFTQKDAGGMQTLYHEGRPAAAMKVKVMGSEDCRELVIDMMDEDSMLALRIEVSTIKKVDGM
jgi:hypothetical protein